MPQVVQGLQKGRLGVELAGSLQRRQPGVVGHHVQAQALVLAGVHPAFGQEALHEADGAQFTHQTSVEGDLVDTVSDLFGRVGRAGPVQRVDLHQQQVQRFGVIDQGPQRGVAAVATVPVGLTINLHSTKDLRQAGTGQQRIDAQVAAVEDPRLPTAHCGGGDEQRQRALLQCLRPHVALQHRAQRVGAAGVELVGAEQAQPLLAPGIQRVVFEIEGRETCPGVGGLVPTAKTTAVGRLALADVQPERPQRRLCASTAAFGPAGGQNGRIQGAGAGARDAGRRNRSFIQQPVQHTPGESAVRAAALQGQVDGKDVARSSLGRHAARVTLRGCGTRSPLTSGRWLLRPVRLPP